MTAAEQKSRKIVIVAYKPKQGCEGQLLELTREHVPLLRRGGLATDHPVTICQAADGTVIEVFEWEAGTIERAHSNDVLNQLWREYAAGCTYVPPNTLAEAADMFAGFVRVD